MNEPLPHRFDWHALPALAAGLILLCGFDDFGGFVLAVVPGTLLLTTAASLLLWPGSGQLTRFMALGGVLGVLLGIPQLFVSGPAYGVVTIVLSTVAFLCAGRLALQRSERAEEAPEPPGNWKVDAKAALDETLVAYFSGSARMPDGAQAAELCEQVGRIEELLRTADWARPQDFNPAPPAPEDASTELLRAAGHDGLRLRFGSGYTPPDGLPFVPDWLTNPRNARCHALVFRQRSAGRPWLLGIHGYRMGQDWLDLSLFRPQTLVTQLGYNLVVPSLPLHGPRRCGFRSGDHYLDGRLLDLLYAQAQALWDLRRTLAWIRTQEPDACIGVLGYSLGGYNAALLAAHEDGLDFVVAGIPVADLAMLLWQHLPEPVCRYFLGRGLDAARYAAILKLVSPLALPPRLARERLGIFAGNADCVVPPAQPLLLSKHWNVPVNWYPGGHLTFRGEPAVGDTLKAVAASAGWTSAVSAEDAT